MDPLAIVALLGWILGTLSATATDLYYWFRKGIGIVYDHQALVAGLSGIALLLLYGPSPLGIVLALTIAIYNVVAYFIGWCASGDLVHAIAYAPGLAALIRFVPEAMLFLVVMGIATFGLSAIALARKTRLVPAVVPLGMAGTALGILRFVCM